MSTTRASLPPELQAVAERVRDTLRADGTPDFDVDAWLQDWLGRPQPALGGATPTDLLGSAAAIASVRRALGAILSGAYQ